MNRIESVLLILGSLSLMACGVTNGSSESVSDGESTLQSVSSTSESETESLSSSSQTESRSSESLSQSISFDTSEDQQSAPKEKPIYDGLGYAWGVEYSGKKLSDMNYALSIKNIEKTTNPVDETLWNGKGTYRTANCSSLDSFLPILQQCIDDANGEGLHALPDMREHKLSVSRYSISSIKQTVEGETLNTFSYSNYNSLFYAELPDGRVACCSAGSLSTSLGLGTQEGKYEVRAGYVAKEGDDILKNSFAKLQHFGFRYEYETEENHAQRMAIISVRYKVTNTNNPFYEKIKSILDEDSSFEWMRITLSIAQQSLKSEGKTILFGDKVTEEEADYIFGKLADLYLPSISFYDYYGSIDALNSVNPNDFVLSTTEIGITG